MAADHALALRLKPGHAVLRLYQWSPATISLGRNQPARGCYDEAAAERAGLAFVRRPTGGRAVLHDRELTYAVATHARELGGPRVAYQSIHRALQEGLRELGVEAEQSSPVSPTPTPDLRPCFSDPAPGELHLQGRKLVGSAQARFGRVILQHGSILTVNDQSQLRTVSLEGQSDGDAQEAQRGPGLTLAALGLDVPLDALADAIEAGFRKHLAENMTTGTWAADERAQARELDALYRGPAWTWRR